MNEDTETYALIGAAMEVHRQLGSGFLEQDYKDAFCTELKIKGIEFDTEVALPVYYKGLRLATGYRADFVCYGNILVEMKALKAMSTSETAECINYLKASGLEKCLLLNFGASSLEYKRLVLSAKA